MVVIISEEWLNLVKKVHAYPKVEDLIFSDDQIRELCIFPAMRKYFVKFPIKVDAQETISQNHEVAFPDDYTFGLLDLRVVGKGMTSNEGSSFWDIIKFQTTGGGAMSGAGMYGIRRYNPNFLSQSMFDRQQQFGTIQNQMTTIDYRIDRIEKKIKIGSNITGQVLISWAKYSEDFDEIKYEQQMNVIKLAQANLLELLADTAGLITDNNLDVIINVDALREQATTKKDELKELWENYPSIVYLFCS